MTSKLICQLNAGQMQNAAGPVLVNVTQAMKKAIQIVYMTAALESDVTIMKHVVLTNTILLTVNPIPQLQLQPLLRM